MRSRTGSSGSSTGPGARSRRSALRRPRLPPCRSRAMQTWPSITVAVCSYNGARTLRQCLGAVRGARVPELRAARRRRRVDRRHRGARRGVRRACRPNREPGARERSQHRDRGRPRRDRRFPRRRRLPRPALALVRCRHLPIIGRRRGRRPQSGGARGRSVCTMRRGDSGKPDPRPSLRPRGRAHPRLQHGVSPGCARGRRRLRSAVSHRGRRRRHLLAPCRPRLAARLRAGGRRLAPSPCHAARLLAPAAGVRPRGGAARAQVAGEVQRRRAPLVGRAAVPAPPLSSGLAPPAGAVRHLGHGRLPARGAGPLVHLGGARRDSRVVPAARRPRRPLCAGGALAAAALGAARARSRRLPAHGADRGRRVPRAACSRRAEPFGAHPDADAHVGTSPCPAVRTPARTSQPRADTLASSRPARARGPVSAECLAVERVVARAVCLDPFDRDRA